MIPIPEHSHHVHELCLPEVVVARIDVPAKKRHHLQGMVPDPLPFAPERAAQLLVRAGWVDTDNDNIREKNGQEFRFTLSTTATELAQAVYIQDQFRRAGIRMEISTYDRVIDRY